MTTENEPTPMSEDPKKRKLKKNIWLELLRFGVVGVVATLVDYCCRLAIQSIPGVSSWERWVVMALAYSFGFAVSTIVNFILSRIWVFQNVDKKINTKSQKSFWIFTGLGAGGFFLGLGLQELGTYICSASFGLDITSVGYLNFWKQAAGVTLAWALVSVLGTCVTLVYNYLTRKFLLFREPKKEESSDSSLS